MKQTQQREVRKCRRREFRRWMREDFRENPESWLLIFFLVFVMGGTVIVSLALR